ncbi:hypothetical protein FSP39_017376 [Pinctada imbricata]|uniref:Acyltransferase 3 domain-containing protein n=1 Tax=Pinctada imbricata TaxID=66713 RepID=A0AA88YHR6_PINIB|nr:hypothetical protein FSP39_017376 [Pinctada imbricata]
MSQTKKDGHLPCLDGLRVISMWWIILGHSYVAMTYAVSNLLEVTTIVKRISFQAILASSFAVDTFFFLSGLLMTFVTLRRIALNDGKMKWYLFIIHRILRLTPVYAVVLFTYTYLTAYAAKGPLGLYLKQNDFFKIVSLCKTKWWTNLLYINNFYPHNGDFVNVCMPWSWYLAADVQFYVISPILLILLYRYRNIALSVIVSLILGSMFVRGFIISEYNINFFREMTSAILYIKPYTRISSFLIGALLGYALQHETYLWQPKKIFVFFGWIMAFTLMALVVYGPHHYYLDLDNASSTASLFYGTFCRTTWCLALAWIVFACATGHGGPVQQFLSFRIWEPLGRLTYCAYLVHPIIIFGHLVLAGDIRHYTDIAMAWIYIGNLVVTYCVAFVFYLVVEAPVAGIEKRMLKCCNRSSTTARELPRTDANQLL